MAIDLSKRIPASDIHARKEGDTVVIAGWARDVKSLGKIAFIKLRARGVAPAGILFGITNPVMIQGLVLADIPAMHHVSPDPFTVLESGDRVRMSPAQGTVERLSPE